MKTTLILAASLFASVAAFGQGTVIFVNNWGTGKAPVYDFDPAAPTTAKSGNTANGIPTGTQTYGGALLAGTGYTAQLWGHVGSAQAESALEALGPTTTFRTGTAAGFINSVSVSVPNAPLGGAGAVGATFQLRAWNNAGGTIGTYAAALIRGKSGLFDVAALGGTGTPATPDPNLTGLQSFQLIATVPEPSSIALGVIGLGTLMFLRRRK